MLPARLSYQLPPTHILHLVHEPLLGVPLSPLLHRRLLLTPLHGRHTTSYDVIPGDPRRPSTLGALLCGRCVHAVVRVRRFGGTGMPDATAAAATRVRGGRAAGMWHVRADEGAVRTWARQYRGCACEGGSAGLSLCGWSCWRFATLLQRELTAGRLAAHTCESA